MSRVCPHCNFTSFEVGDLVEIAPGTPVMGPRGMVVGVLECDFYEVVNVNSGGAMAGRADIDTLPGFLLSPVG